MYIKDCISADVTHVDTCRSINLCGCLAASYS